MTENSASAPSEPRRILVLGATGYVGGRLIPELIDAGHRVRCLARSPRKLADRPWRSEVEVHEGDLLEPDTLVEPMADIDVVYYLVHSLGSGDDFEETERTSARNTREAAVAAGVAQIIYLGGLGEADDELSPHLRSRWAVGEELAGGSVPVTELRAAVILGSGSASFEMLRGLTEVLPFMITPRWVQETRCQPIAIRDVLRALLDVLGRADAEGIWEIGGADVTTYAGMMRSYAEQAELRDRVIVPVPVLTPRLSSHWVDLVTGLPSGLAASLVESLQNDVVVGERALTDLIPRETLGLDEAIGDALSAVRDLDVPTRWAGRDRLSTAALPRPEDPDWSGGTVLEDDRSTEVAASKASVMAEIKEVGGPDRWYGYDFLWSIRGWGDKIFGGPGARRGRRHPHDLRIGDVVDTFVVEELTDDLLRLRAEMKLPGYGWLEWSLEDVSPAEDGGPLTRLTQRARFVPKGLWGRAYWLVVVPFHQLVFTRMLASIARQAEEREKEHRPSEAAA